MIKLTKTQLKQLKYISKFRGAGCHHNMARVLERHGFIKHDERHFYSITEKGKQFLKGSEKMEDKISEIERISNELVEKQKSLAKDIETQIGVEIGKMIKMDKHIHSFFWTQYTPHFNDGEPCTFGVGDFFYILEDDIEGETKDERNDFVYDLMMDEGSNILSSDQFSSAEKYVKILEDFVETLSKVDTSNEKILEYHRSALLENSIGGVWWLSEYVWLSDIIKMENLGTYMDKKYSYELKYSIDELTSKIEKYKTQIEDTKKKYKKLGYDQTSKVVSKIVKTLNSIPDDVLEMAFGDHAKIIINENGLEVEEYIHD